MNVPVPQSLDLQQINSAIIALKNAIEALESKVNAISNTSNS